jgi:hypothetical protein
MNQLGLDKNAAQTPPVRQIVKSLLARIASTPQPDNTAIPSSPAVPHLGDVGLFAAESCQDIAAGLLWLWL